MEFQSLDINELVLLARQSSDSAFDEIERRYMPLLLAKRAGFSAAYNAEELLNEARVGLHKAVMSYDLALGKASFGTYAGTCVHNHLLDFISKSSSANISSDGPDIDSVAVTSGIQSHLEHEEALSAIKAWARSILSEYEYEVFLLWLSGYKTAEIAERLGHSPKSVDNAKSRMFKHLRDMRDAIDSIFKLN